MDPEVSLQTLTEYIQTSEYVAKEEPGYQSVSNTMMLVDQNTQRPTYRGFASDVGLEEHKYLQRMEVVCVLYEGESGIHGSLNVEARCGRTGDMSRLQKIGHRHRT